MDNTPLGFLVNFLRKKCVLYAGIYGIGIVLDEPKLVQPLKLPLSTGDRSLPFRHSGGLFRGSRAEALIGKLCLINDFKILSNR